MAADDKKSKPKEKAAPKEKTAIEPKDKTAEAPAKAETKPEAKTETKVETKAEAQKNYSRGEGQKTVTQAYKDNWNAIYGKKKR